MSVARAVQRNAPYRVAHDTTKILVIEDSVAVAAVLKAGIEEETSAIVVHCASFAEAEPHIDGGDISFAVTGLSLPDAAGRSILDRLERSGIPAVVFTARHDEEAETHFAEQRLLDYILKDSADSVARAVHSVKCIVENSAFTVLVVDDARSARSGLVDLLTRRQFKVFEARSGSEALKIMAVQPNIDLIITDYHMPDMDGYQLIQRIRTEKTSEELRIVGVSSSSDRRLSALFLKAGASDFIYRPFVAEELQCRIDNNIETLKQLRRLKYYAERDPLTGLSNRRLFFETGIRMARENERANRASAVAILDVDHFKKVNDTYGHEAGDVVLKAVADTLAEKVEGTRHLVARLGGEEFALYLHDLAGRAAFDFCNGVREAVEALVIEVNDKMIHITASIGVAAVQPEETFDNPLNAADQFLYMAKNGGRNRVFCEGVLLGQF